MQLALVLVSAITALLQLAIGWYGWRNPRTKMKLVRKTISALVLAWGLFSVYRTIVPDPAAVELLINGPNLGMSWAMYGITLIILVVILVVVRKKYYQRVEELEVAQVG